MVSNVSFWICDTSILQPKFQHHPQESHSSGPHRAHGPVQGRLSTAETPDKII